MGRLAEPTSVDLRWLDGREEVAFGLPPVAGRTNRLEITRVVLTTLAQWYDMVDVVFLQLVSKAALAVRVGAVPVLSHGDLSAFWFGELFAFGGLLSLVCVELLVGLLQELICEVEDLLIFRGNLLQELICEVEELLVLRA